VTDHPTTLAIDRTYERRLENARVEAPKIAAALLAKHRTIGRALSRARWYFHGWLQHMVVDALLELDAARETAPATLKPRIRRPRGAIVMVAPLRPPPTPRSRA